MLKECPTLLRRMQKYMWLKEPALHVVNQVILQEIACSRESHPHVTDVTLWVMWPLSAMYETEMCIVKYARIDDM